MPKFFVNKENISETKIIITGADIKHISKVLRYDVGDKLEISDGHGNRYLAQINRINKNEIVTDILESYKEEDSKIDVTLIQAIPKSSKMDAIIQKCTELGIKEIIPFESHRTVVEIKDEKSKRKKLERWQKVANEACKQCQRAVIPQVKHIHTWRQVLEEVKNYDLSIIAYENENNSLKDVLKSNDNARKICIIIGPEGGFEESEVSQLLNKGVSAITLGKRILRTETAGMALLSIIMYEFDEMEN